MDNLHERAKKLTESVAADKANKKAEFDAEYSKKCLELQEEFKTAFSEVLEMLADGEITFKAGWQDPRYDFMGRYIEFTHKNKSIRMDFRDANSYRYEYIPYRTDRNNATMCYGKWPIDDFILWISNKFFADTLHEVEQTEYTNFELQVLANGDIKLTTTDGNIYFLEKSKRDAVASIVALSNPSVKLFDPAKNKPNPSPDDITMSVDVCIIDEDGVNGLAWYCFEDEKWKFHTDTLVDYDEPDAETKWLWYYPVVNESVFKIQP